MWHFLDEGDVGLFLVSFGSVNTCLLINPRAELAFLVLNVIDMRCPREIASYC